MEVTKNNSINSLNSKKAIHHNGKIDGAIYNISDESVEGYQKYNQRASADGYSINTSNDDNIIIAGGIPDKKPNTLLYYPSIVIAKSFTSKSKSTFSKNSNKIVKLADINAYYPTDFKKILMKNKTPLQLTELIYPENEFKNVESLNDIYNTYFYSGDDKYELFTYFLEGNTFHRCYILNIYGFSVEVIDRKLIRHNGVPINALKFELVKQQGPTFSNGGGLVKNNTFNSYNEILLSKYLPKDNKCYCNKESRKIHLSGLKPNKTMFYFGAHERDFSKKLETQKKAYCKLENSGVTRVNKNGEATIYLDAPQLYINMDGNVYPRHFHCVYWSDTKNTWNKKVCTHELLTCFDIENFDKIGKKVTLFDARTSELFDKKHINGFVSMPYTKNWTENSVISNIKNYDGNKLTPILIYSGKDMSIAVKLYKKLNKLGFYNTMHLLE